MGCFPRFVRVGRHKRMVSASGLLRDNGGVGRLDHHVGLLVFIYVLVATVFLALGGYSWDRTEQNVTEFARERGRVLFSVIELTREWNARHGGIYVLTSATTQPNSYLEHPFRDLTTVDGHALTMVNPAFMTRQIAELAERSTGVRFRITSTRPMRPDNLADAWEAESLRRFEGEGERERIEFVKHFMFNGEVRPAHRYMAPLKVKPACMQCHEKQGYRIGDIRGGISVTMPAEDLLKLAASRHRDAALVLSICFVLAVALLHGLVARARRQRLVLEQIARDQEAVIASRTEALKKLNGVLSGELQQRRLSEHELRLAATVFSSAAEAIMVTDAENRILRVNPAFIAITGYTEREVLGRNPRLLSSGRHSNVFYAEMWAALGSRGHWEGEIWNRHKSGEVRIEWLSISVIEGECAGAGTYLAVFHDITRYKEAEELLRHKAYHDALTDLPNRLLFNDRLNAALHQARRYGRSFALILVDLDRFKEVNDTLGHAAGDELLVEVAARLRSCMRDSDTVARLGGDEFAILLPQTAGVDEALDVAQRALALLAAPFHLGVATVQISGSIGIALYPMHAESVEVLLKRCDSAMYAAKSSGRNTCRVFDESLTDLISGDAKMLHPNDPGAVEPPS